MPNLKSVLNKNVFFKKLFVCLLPLLALFLIKPSIAAPIQKLNATGAGSSFAAPIFSQWAADFQQATKTEINYQATGSSAGYRQLLEKTIDFAASDKPISAEDIQSKQLVQFPAIVGGVVVIINIDGVKSNQLVLSGPVLEGIYTGKIKKWNAPEITAINPNLNLPNRSIAVVKRADGSGTTYLFTHYLSKFSQKTANEQSIQPSADANLMVGIGGKGNQGVATSVQKIPNSIGYVEYAYAKTGHLIVTNLINSEKQIVSPNLESFASAAAHADWSTSEGQILTNQAGSQTWPIVGATFVVMPKHHIQANKSIATLKFFKWAFANGYNSAKNLDYVMLPKAVIENLYRQVWPEIVDEKNQSVQY